MPQQELTAKQRKFIELFVETGNKSGSYREAYGLEYDRNQNGKLNQAANAILDSAKGKAYYEQLRTIYLERVGDKAEFIAQQLIDDITYRDEKGKKSPTWAKSIDLLQKQLGLQSQKVDLASQNEVNISIVKEKADE